MEILLFWLILSILAGWIASQKGRSGIGFFLLSVVLSPIVGILAAFGARSALRPIDNPAAAESPSSAAIADLPMQPATPVSDAITLAILLAVLAGLAGMVAYIIILYA